MVLQSPVLMSQLRLQLLLPIHRLWHHIQYINYRNVTNENTTLGLYLSNEVEQTVGSQLITKVNYDPISMMT